MTHQHILPTSNEEIEDLNRFCTSFYTCSKCILQVNTYVAMCKQKYYTVVVKNKYRHLYFPFPNNKKGQTRLTWRRWTRCSSIHQFALTLSAFYLPICICTFCFFPSRFLPTRTNVKIGKRLKKIESDNATSGCERSFQ